MGIFINSGILHTIKFYLLTLSCDFWLNLYLTEDELTLVQVMAWCHQAASNHLSQCLLRSVPPFGVTRPQWVKRNQTIGSGNDFMPSGSKLLCTWASVYSDLLRHMVLQGHKDLKGIEIQICIWPTSHKTPLIEIIDSVDVSVPSGNKRHWTKHHWFR